MDLLTYHRHIKGDNQVNKHELKVHPNELQKNEMRNFVTICNV